MKKFIVTSFIIVLLIFTFLFVYRLYLDKPSFYNSEKVNVYLDGVKDEEYEHVIKDNQIYISANYLMKNELMDFYWEDGYHKISIFNNYNYEVINYNQMKAFYNKEPFDRNDVFIIEDNNLFFNTTFIKEKYLDNIYVDINNLNVVIEENIREYEIIKKTKLKRLASNNSKELKIFESGERIHIYYYENNGWLLARTGDNLIGFIQSSDIKPISKTNYNIFLASNKSKQIKMAWDLVYKPTENFKPFYIPSAIDILGPTWYKLVDEDDLFKDYSNGDYIRSVKESGKDIWGVFSNSFDPDLTSKLLNNGTIRSKIADRILEITEEKNFDAINIDFENIYLKDKEVLSAFIKELYCKAKNRNILMSVDITILSNSENWSLCYDRKVVGKYSDYIMLMAYDENVSGTPGSVASLPWVDYGVQNILESVQSDKVVLSIPFYTRLWEKSIGENGHKVKTTALRIQSAKKTINELEIKLIYDETTGQNYGETTIDGIKYMIWNEDEKSLKSRIEIAKKYDLAGYAIWALEYGTDEMWNLIK